MSQNDQIENFKIESKKEDQFSVPKTHKTHQPQIKLNTVISQPYTKMKKVGRPQHEFLKLLQSGNIPTYKHVGEISLEQLEEHQTQQSAWLALDGIVYDVTLYIDFHPGGKEKLLEGCGRDATQLFYKNHAWVNAKYLLDKFKIGYLHN